VSEVDGLYTALDSLDNQAVREYSKKAKRHQRTRSGVAGMLAEQ
jgi:hypothetical protein